MSARAKPKAITKAFEPDIGLLQAMNDEDLFGPVFAADSFWTWKVVAKIIDGIALTEKREIALFEEATGRPYNRQARRQWRRLFILAGRRGGKDRFESAIAVWRACLCANWHEHLSAGEQNVVILVSTDRRQASILRRYCEGLLEAPLLAAEVTGRKVNEGIIEFRNSASIEIITADQALIRGRSAIAVLGTETSHWTTDENSACSDEEILAAAEPSMSMCPDGGLMVMASTVYRKKGLMHRVYQESHGNEQSDDLVWFAPSRVMNPALPESVVSKQIEKDPARYQAEFNNVWRTDVSNFLAMEIVTGATDWGIVERPPLGGIHYEAFPDASSGTGQDSFAMAIGHRLNDEARSLIVDAIRERKPRFVAADVIKEFAELLRSYGIHEVTSDNFAAGFSADEWARNGIRFKPCKNSTAENYLCALPLLASKRAHLLDNPTLRTQLCGLERRVVSGHEIVDHQQRASAHDDVSAAVCGLLAEMAAHTPLIITREHVAALAARGPYRGSSPGFPHLGERAALQRQRMMRRYGG
jgi:hypothetical protein